MPIHLSRRGFITVVSGAVITQPLVARAQQANKIPTIGVLWHAGSAEQEAIYLGALRRGFGDLGYVEGKTVALENRFPNEQYDRFFSLAAELVEIKVDVLVAVTRPAAVAAKRATNSIPIVFVAVPDPIGSKIVDSLARPAGNITGLSNMALELSGKRVEFLKEAVPNLSRVALIINTIDPNAVRSHLEESQAAAKALGIQLEPVPVQHAEEIEGAFAKIAKDKMQGVVVTIDGLYYANRKRMADLALEYSLPMMMYSRETLEAGALISYGADQRAMFHHAAAVVNRILKGEKPADLPVEQPTKFELLVNARTAKALGLKIPLQLLLRADEVIE
jgi:putative tryptophan/tyrosine transport system substrate-binding protein